MAVKLVDMLPLMILTHEVRGTLTVTEHNSLQTPAGSQVRPGATGFQNGQADHGEEDVEAITGKQWSLKQESVNSTRNALRIVGELEDTALNTLIKLGDQSGTRSQALDVSF